MSHVLTMRIWSLDPKYLDARGLVALWREGLLAQAVLRGRTRGYAHHPQLERFRGKPLGFLAEYLRVVQKEAAHRGYRFAGEKIARVYASGHLYVTRGQIEFEWWHLMRKLRARNPQWQSRFTHVKRPRAHSLFRIVPGEVESWEKGTV